MKAIILAGGEGRRLRPLTATRPKPLMRVGDRALLDIMIERLAASGVTRAAVTLGYRGDDIEREIGKSLHGVDITYYREDKPLGTAGCVKNCEDFIEDDVLIVSADALTDMDFAELMAHHKEKDAHVTVAVAKRKKPRLYGVVKTASDSRITDFREKPDLPDSQEAEVSCGIYALKREVVDMIPRGVPFDFARDVFLLVKKNLYAYKTSAFWCDIGSFAEYRRSNLLTLDSRFFINRGEQPAVKGEVRDSILGRGSRVLSRAVIHDSVVGRNTRIGSGTRLENCILGDGVTVGENVSISGGAVVGDFAILGDGVRVEDGERVEAYSIHLI